MNNTIRYKNITAEFVVVDAELAKEFLKKNKSNRRLDKNRVITYVEDMKKGYWCFNGDAIRFDVDGNLSDGQHRLESIVKSGISQVFLVVRNVEKESKRTIDTGKSRTGSDVLMMFSDVGVRDSGVLSSAISKLVIYENGGSLTGGGGYRYMTTNSVIEEYYKSNYLEITNSLDFINMTQNHYALLLQRSESLFLHVIFKRISEKEADIFMKKIITGLDITDNSNEKLLRSILMKRAMKTLKIKPSELLYTVVKAWNRNRRGGVYTTESNLKYSSSKDNGYPVAF